jgi:hypothetical protein
MSELHRVLEGINGRAGRQAEESRDGCEPMARYWMCNARELVEPRERGQTPESKVYCMVSPNPEHLFPTPGKPCDVFDVEANELLTFTAS